jgi:hypothetical protein
MYCCKYESAAANSQWAPLLWSEDVERIAVFVLLLLHAQVGKMIDCTSYFELEQAEYAAKGINLSVEAWLVKLMVRVGALGERRLFC